MTNRSTHSRRGQTLVEALVALSILTTGFIGIVTLLTKSFQLNRTTANDTQATYLASEGIEIAKNIIDYDVYYGISQGGANDWACSFALGSGASGNYELDYSSVTSGCARLASVPAAQAQADALYFNATTDLYGYNQFTAVKTAFTRDIKVTMIPGVYPNGIDVQSTVTWKSGVLGNTISLEDVFYNYK